MTVCGTVYGGSIPLDHTKIVTLFVPSRVIKDTLINGTHDGYLAKKVGEKCCNNDYFFIASCRQVAEDGTLIRSEINITSSTLVDATHRELEKSGHLASLISWSSS